MLGVLLALALTLSACAGGAGEEAQGQYMLWFPTDGLLAHGPALEAQPWDSQDDPRPRALLEALLAGPTREGLVSPFPRGVTLRQLTWSEERPGVVQVSLSEQYGALADIALTLADYCIVLTLAQVEGVEGVEITAAGYSANYRSHQTLSAGEAVLWDDLAEAS